MKKLILLGSAALLLGGCDMIPFFKVTSPQRKPGLWERVDTREGQTVTSQWCFDAASDKRVPILPRERASGGGGGGGGGPPSCSKRSVTKTSDGYVADSVCDRRGASITSHTVISGDFNSKFTVASSVDIAGAPIPQMNGHHATTTTWTYKGECPAEMQPGQLKCPNGDVVDMAALRTGGGCGPGFGGGGFGGGRRGGEASNAANATNSAPSNSAQ